MSENSLGLFHSELVNFLQQDIAKRCADEGFDLKTDPQLSRLLDGLKPQSSDTPLPLNEIIENYHFLFGSRGPIHIEKILMEAFPTKDFIDLNLSRYYPRIYRGLPRLYHKSSPTQSHIKKSFTHLPSLKKLAVKKALYSLYSKCSALGNVTLFTWVIADGLGDYQVAVEVMRILKGRFPDLQLKLIALIPERYSSQLSYPENALILTYKKESLLSDITPEALQCMRSSDLILQIPTYYPHSADLFEALTKIESSLPLPKLEKVGEYGFLESTDFNPASGGYSMGLHFLETGVLVRKSCQASWSDVRNEKLLQWRCPENHFYLAYLASATGGGIYLHSLLKSLENDLKGIDICTPNLKWLIEFTERQNKAGRPVLEWDMGVQSIEVYFEDQTYLLPIAESGKKVRILCPGQISQSDFRILLALSGDWVAVRGNQSLSEVISQNKPFFYDGLEHNRYFLKDLIALAENRVETESTLVCLRGIVQAFLYNLPTQDADWVDETHFQECEEWTSIALGMGLALQEPETLEGYKKLNRIIAEEFSCNSFLCHLVQRALTHRNYPELENEENQNLELFAAGSLPFRELISSMKQSIF